ncbi:MAG: response regulator transcription factor [Pseudomonadota bacterium]
MKNILIIEDEEDMIRGLKLNLENAGYSVLSAATGEAGVELAFKHKPDLVLLDIMLPGKDGLEVCKELRLSNLMMPVIMLTARGTEMDKVLGLEFGADDYIVKPFGLQELLARIKAHLRRQEGYTDEEFPHYRFENIHIDFVRLTIDRGNKKIPLTALEADILKYLIRYKGQVVKRDKLLDHVWGYDSYPTTRTIDTHISKIRKKIEKDPAHPRHIFSIYGEGYRFVD